MRVALVFVCFIFCFTAATAQYTQVVVDVKTKMPIPYATIKVLHSNKGCIAKQDGSFKLEIAPTDSVFVSSIGYYDTVILGSSIEKDTIVLRADTKELAEIIVHAKKVINRHVIGNGAKYIAKKVKCRTSNTYDDECLKWASGGATEFAEPMILPDASKTYRLGKVYIPAVLRNCWRPIFIQVYEPDSAGMPGKLILKQHIIPDSVAYVKEKLVIDLSKNNVYLTGYNRFYLSFSWDDTQKFTDSCFTGFLMFTYGSIATFSRSVNNINYAWAGFDFRTEMDKVRMKPKYTTLFAAEIEELE